MENEELNIFELETDLDGKPWDDDTLEGPWAWVKSGDGNAVFFLPERAFLIDPNERLNQPEGKTQPLNGPYKDESLAIRRINRDLLRRALNGIIPTAST